MIYHIRESRGGDSVSDPREFATLFDALESATLKALRVKHLGGEASIAIGQSAPGETRVTKVITIHIH